MDITPTGQVKIFLLSSEQTRKLDRILKPPGGNHPSSFGSSKATTQPSNSAVGAGLGVGLFWSHLEKSVASKVARQLYYMTVFDFLWTL